MQVKKYLAADMQEAIQKIKQELGSRAVIISTRKVKKSSGAFGMFGKEMLEVTAAKGEDAAAVTKKPNPDANVYDNAALAKPSSFGKNEGKKLVQPIQDDILELKDLLLEMRRGFRRDVNDEATISHMRYEISELKQMVNSLISQSGELREKDLHENLIAIYQQLIFNGVEEKFSKRLIEEAQRKIPEEEIDNYSYVKLYIARMFMQVIKTEEKPEELKGNKPSILTFLGPTGVGKTTTVAKIASTAKIQNPDVNIGLITIDTFRVGGVNQLQEYARMIKIPIRVVADKVQLEDSLKEFADKDLVLIDSAGRSQRDELQMAELRDLLQERKDFVNLLVVSATTKDTDMNEITKRFGAIALQGVIFTKLDESTSYGSLFNHAIRFKLPFTYLTTGQNVPEDIETATRERLIDLLLNISGDEQNAE